MAAFYADENFPAQVTEALRLLGHDVLTAYEADRPIGRSLTWRSWNSRPPEVGLF